MNINTAIKHLKGSRRRGRTIGAIYVQGDLNCPITLDKLGNVEPRKITSKDLNKDWAFIRFVQEKSPKNENYICYRIERYISKNLENPYISYQIIEDGIAC